MSEKRLRIDVDFKAGSTFIDESEGSDGCAYKAHDTIKKEWRHLNFFEHECYLTARVPRVKRSDGKVRMVSPAWSGKVSGFTLLFEALLMQLCKAIPVHNVSQLLGVSDYLIWHILDVYIDEAKLDEDLSDIESIGMDAGQSH